MLRQAQQPEAKKELENRTYNNKQQQKTTLWSLICQKTQIQSLK